MVGRVNSSSPPANRRSTVRYIGMETNTNLMVQEGPTPFTVTVNATAPLNFKYDCSLSSDVGLSNSLTITLQTTSQGHNGSCNNRGSEIALHKNIGETFTCSPVTVTVPVSYLSNGQVSFDVPLYAVMDGKYNGGNKNVKLQLGTGQLNQIDSHWQDFNLPMIQVTYCNLNIIVFKVVVIFVKILFCYLIIF